MIEKEARKHTFSIITIHLGISVSGKTWGHITLRTWWNPCLLSYATPRASLHQGFADNSLDKESSTAKRGSRMGSRHTGICIWPSFLSVHLQSLSVLLLIGVCWGVRKEEPLYWWNKVMDRLPTYSSCPEALSSFQQPWVILRAAFTCTEVSGTVEIDEASLQWP